MNKTTPEREIEIERIVAVLVALSVGQTATYQVLTDAIGRDVQADARLVMITARKRAEKQTGQRFETVFKVGIKRLAAADVVGIGATARGRIKRASTRAFKRLTGLSYNDVDKATQARIDAERSLMGAISALSAERNVTAIQTGTQTGPIPAIEVYRALTKSPEPA